MGNPDFQWENEENHAQKHFFPFLGQVAPKHLTWIHFSDPNRAWRASNISICLPNPHEEGGSSNHWTALLGSISCARLLVSWWLKISMTMKL
jgi:hypothetical protein